MRRYLRYRDRSLREKELEFLTEAERRDFSSNGNEAVERFTPRSRDLWTRWAAEERVKMDAQIAHRNQWRKDINELSESIDNKQKQSEWRQIDAFVKERRHHLDFRNYFQTWLPPGRMKLANKADWVSNQAFLLQCYILNRLPRAPYCRDNRHFWELSEDEFFREGACLDRLYPVVARETHLFILDSLAYNFGYGPNAFPWKLKRVERGHLKSKPTTLYLVSINLGSLTGGKNCFAWKIGITTKERVVGEGKAMCRYYGKYTQHVDLIREKRYACGELAYMREQTYVEQVSREKTRPLHGKYDHKKLSSHDLSVLGPSEWVLEGRSKSLAAEYFDRLTRTD